MTLTFENHAPIKTDHAANIAEYDYRPAFGHHRILIIKGNLYHVLRDYSSGEWHNGRDPQTVRTYLFGARTREEVTAWLLAKGQEKQEGNWPAELDFPAHPWPNALLLALGYEGEAA